MIKFTQKDTKNFSIANRFRRVFSLIIQKILEHPSQVYRISHLLPSIPKISEPFEKLLELLSDDIFDAEEKPDITDELVSFDEVIILELQWMVDLMAVDDLYYRLVMDALIFSE